MVVATDAFVTLARDAARAQGLADARIATVPHPLGGVARETLHEHADTAVDTVLALLAGRAP